MSEVGGRERRRHDGARFERVHANDNVAIVNRSDLVSALVRHGLVVSDRAGTLVEKLEREDNQDPIAWFLSALGSLGIIDWLPFDLMGEFPYPFDRSVQQLAASSGGRFAPEDISLESDEDENWSRVTFRSHGREYRAEGHDSSPHRDLVDAANSALGDAGAVERFVTLTNLVDGLLVVFAPPGVIASVVRELELPIDVSG